MEKEKRNAVIKIGTDAISRSDGHIDLGIIQSMFAVIADHTKAFRFAIVTSGAVGLGKSVVERNGMDEIAWKQACSTVGQKKLIRAYDDIASNYNLEAAQILVTNDNFSRPRDTEQIRANIKNLMSQGIVPIINENDFLSPVEITFGDNDKLAALVGKKIDATRLALFSNIPGLMRNYRQANESLIQQISIHDPEIPSLISDETSGGGRGGMGSKVGAIQHFLTDHAFANESLAAIANGKSSELEALLDRILLGNTGDYTLFRQ